jgi:hypothetical protein
MIAVAAKRAKARMLSCTNEIRYSHAVREAQAIVDRTLCETQPLQASAFSEALQNTPVNPAD